MPPSAVVKPPAGRANRRTAYLVKRLETLIRVQLDAGLRERGITGGQYMLLSLVSREGGISSAELARRMSVTPQSMNESITALEAKVLIARSEDPENRRILRIQLTRDGRRMLTACDRAVDRIEAGLFAPLAVRGLADFRSALERLLEVAREQAASD